MIEQLTQAEKDEIYLDLCQAFEESVISEANFRRELASIGYNATDIEDVVRQHRRLQSP